MPAKRITFEDKAREGIKNGVEKLAKAVKSTLGPRGRTVLIGKGFGSPLITKDGVTVAKEIEVEEPLEHIGAQVVKEVASRANDTAGDGTTTATVLAEAIFSGGFKRVSAGANPLHLKRGIEKAVAAVVEEVKSMKQDANTPEAIKAVATIASNNDSEIGGKIAEAMDAVGNDGSITVEEGQTLETYLSFVEGMEFDKGYQSPHFVTDQAALECVMDNPVILLCDRKLNNIQELVPLLEAYVQDGNLKNRPLLIIAEEFSNEVLGAMVLNRLRGIFTSCAVKSPAFGERRTAILGDMAALTGATVITSDGVGTALDKADLSDLGVAKRATVRKDSTTLITPDVGESERVQERVAQIKAEMDNTDSGWERDKLQERLAKLSGGVAQIFVGATSESEMKEKKARVEDALHATRAAAQEGTVPGGGVTLLRCRRVIHEMTELEGDEAMGADIVYDALEKPLFWIATNAGDKGDVVVERVEVGSGDFGYNADTRKYGNLIEQGIIDPTKVVCSTLINAAGVAGLLLSTDTVIVDAPDDNPAPPMGGMPPGMGGF